ncbi:hypothetical protein PF005_g1773 [Phytophthora fragariae]|uniref:UDENN domain-containing protein n=1 Tax=Phytophthora fragariae TaxID=53985 RepID=A0A6A3ZIT6_9STRA|nr:hypothetical protein PF009_g1819 [Phytophthora fragariae]KAE9029022.1 hypothetical protein PF011_g1289 [Phytophthora fragariae]KAE9137036.1 hypothetical protein PF010_g1452 [Phytophthora fragariae]KAE9137208.1 hypothetical protein PF007_g1883 [Phytophthora fragariae]KAE9153084.1 hypothetical protein PF006_g2742 [Phytophthora fragariae]
MSDSEEDSGSVGRQKSIFSGMGRVKQINHLREKWSPKPKSPLPADRTFVESPPSSPWSRRPSPDKYAQGPYAGDSGRGSPQSVKGSPRRQPVVTVVDMERYLAINTWLEHNGVNVAQINASPDKRGISKDYGLFDDMYSSLDILENSLMSELAYLNFSSDNGSENVAAAKAIEQTSTDPLSVSSPALFDYLVVIAPDMVDVTIHNYWNLRENVFEATVAFAHPPESQFRVESLEHFCFPTGINATTGTTAASIDKSVGENSSSSSRHGEFFVLMISGGGVQGQSVQYAMCMKGTVQIPDGGDDGKNLLLPICYCIIAQIPFIPFFRSVLQGLLDNLRDELEATGCSGSASIITDKHAGYIDDTLQNLKRIPLPDKGLSVSVDVFPPPSSELILTRPHKEHDADEKVALLLQWALPSLLSRLSIDCLLQILSLLLVEMKFIVVSDEIPLLSAATLGLASLLQPLGWAGPLISVLPPSMHEYMEAPVPLICGVDELPLDFECSKGTCILYLAESRVQLHVEDKRSFDALQMPEVENLSCDLTRFTKEMLGRVTGSFRDNVTPLSTHLVIHRVRRHIEHLISVCAHTRETYRAGDSELHDSENRFVDVFMKTQMFQKHQDDQPMATPIDQINHQVLSDQPVVVEAPMAMSTVSTQHDGLKSAASVLFQIALAGVSTLPRSSSRTSVTAKTAIDLETEAQNPEHLELPIMDEPEPGSVKLSSASSPTARIFSSMKNSPNEKAESPTRGQELLSPTPSEQSVQADRPGRTFVWPLSQSELDIFWVADEANAVSPTVVSPGGAQRLVLHSPMSDMFESPRRSPNNESIASYVDGPKSMSRSEHGGIVNAQRADTDTTISIFDTAMSEALGSADTIDDAWLFDTSDDHILSSHQDDDSDEDRGTKRDSSAEECGTPPHNDEHVKDEAFEQNVSVNNPRRSWHQSLNDQNDERTEHQESHDTVLTPDQAKILITGISIDSRGAWDGWSEGKMFVSPDFTTLTWERRVVAFAALNMNIADIASIFLDEAQTIPASEIKQRRIQLNFGIEAIHFQFSNSPHHDEFFSALQHLVRPTLDRGGGRKETLSSVSPVPSPVPFHPPTSLRNEEQHVAPGNHEEDTTVAAVHAVPAQQETDIDQFKRKLQRGFLVEKHGRLGKPHAKLIFTDALCTHIMWRKPPATGAGDHHDLEHLDDQLHHRPSLFSHNKSIPVDSITAIVTGRQTIVFRRAAANKSNERMCLSILTPTRTLDICAYSLEGFQELHRGFSSLLEEIKRTRDRLD